MNSCPNCARLAAIDGQIMREMVAEGCAELRAELVAVEAEAAALREALTDFWHGPIKEQCKCPACTRRSEALSGDAGRRALAVIEAARAVAAAGHENYVPSHPYSCALCALGAAVRALDGTTPSGREP